MYIKFVQLNYIKLWNIKNILNVLLNKKKNKNNNFNFLNSTNKNVKLYKQIQLIIFNNCDSIFI
jgi:hypothetical protein